MKTLGIKRITIRDNERGLLFRKNRFVKILGGGEHWFFDLLNDITVEKYDMTLPEFNHRLAKFFLQTYPVFSEHLTSYELTDKQVGLCYIDGHLTDIIPPNSFKSYWTPVAKVAVQVIDIEQDYVIAHEILHLLAYSKELMVKPHIAQAIQYVEVADNCVGLLFLNGKLTQVLTAGYYGYWRFNRNITVKHIDCRLQVLEVSGQEILTKDKVSLRLNLSCTYQVVNPEQAALKVADFRDYLYRALQLELREAVGTKTLDELLSDKDTLNKTIADNVRSQAEAFGLLVGQVGVKDIILPGEMKTILNQVVEAQKTAEANIIKRREETAATRSLHNTAKVMEGNPILLRLKELEILEKISEKIEKITVYGGLESILTDLVKMVPKDKHET